MIDQPYKVYVQPEAFLFIDHDGSKVPYQVSAVDDGAHFVVGLKDILNKEDSDRMGGLDIWIPLSEVKSRHQRSPRNLKDKWDQYQIENVNTKERHDIIRVEEFPQQLMAIIKIEEKEILIPLSDQLIQEIDKKEKIVRMEIPEGLFGL